MTLKSGAVRVAIGKTDEVIPDTVWIDAISIDVLPTLTTLA